MVKIRPAVQEDVEYTPRLIDMAGKGNTAISGYELMFPGPLEERLEKIGWMFLNAEEIWAHYTKYKIAEVDGRVAGTLCTFSRGDDDIWAWRRTYREMGLKEWEILALVWRLTPFFRVNPSIPENTLVIENVATFPEFRRRGVISALLEAAVEQGRREKYPRVQVAVMIGNTAAQKAYEKAGFTVTGEYTLSSFRKIFGTPGMRRLTLEMAG